MKKVVYTGPHAAVDIPAVNITLRRGEPSEVKDKVAKELLAKSYIVEAPEPEKQTNPTPDKENE